MSDVKVEPLRSLDDFLLTSARFQIPDFSNLDRWNRRVKANLIYYQTNYFLMSIIIFLIVGILNPAQMMIGAISVGGIVAGYSHLISNQEIVANYQRKHPLVCLVAILVGGCTAASLLRSVMVFSFGIVLSISVVFIHASLRMQNTMNKLANMKEEFSLARSPMTILLDQLGMAIEDLIDE